MQEIELTFLAKTLPGGVKEAEQKELLDIYLPKDAHHPILRIRKSGDRYEITKKQPVNEGDSSHQIETTIPLTKEEFEELAQIEGKRVQKTRYYYTENGTSYEIDVFGGALTGLVLVDVEFSSLEDKAKFTMPEWCLVEVTQESFIAGGMLCGKSYPDLEGKLAEFGYEKVVV